MKFINLNCQSEYCAELFWYFIVAYDFWVIFYIFAPFFTGMLFHLDLKEILCDFIPSQIRQ